MGKLEKFLQEPQRVIVYEDLNFHLRREMRYIEDVQVPAFKIEKIIGEKRKKIARGNTSDIFVGSKP